MKPVYYKNSKGETLSLIEKPFMMETNTNLFNSDWNAVTVGVSSQKIVGFQKGSQNYEISIIVSGNTETEMRENLERLIEFFDYDTVQGTAGQFFVGDYYLNAFLKSTKKEKIFGRTMTRLSCTLVSEDAFWKSVQKLKYQGIDYAHEEEIAYACYFSTNYMVIDSVEENADGTVGVSAHSTGYYGGISFMIDIGSLDDELKVKSITGLTIKSANTPTPTGNLVFQRSSDGETWIDIETHSSMNYGASYTFEVDFGSGRTDRYYRVVNSTVGLFDVDSDNLSVLLKEGQDETVFLDRYGYYTEGIEASFFHYSVMNGMNVFFYDSVGIIYFSARNIVLKRIGVFYDGDVTGEFQRLVDGSWETIVAIDGSASWTGSLECEMVRAIINRPGVDTWISFDQFRVLADADPQLFNSNYVPSDAVIKMKGNVLSPSIIIGDNEYGADVDLSGKTLVINTEEKTIRLYDEDGTFENVYASKTGGFEKIPEGKNFVTWNGYQQIEVDLIQKRSDPKWD